MNPNIRLSPSQTAYMQFLQSQLEVITMPSNAKVFLDITRGLRYIHSKGFAHRNIKPSNILISEGLPVTLVISDFGLSKPISRDTGSCSISHSNSSNGDTACWTAPEMLDDPNDEAYGDKRGTTASDVFSAGCVFFYFLTMGWHPFGEPKFTKQNIKNGESVFIECK